VRRDALDALEGLVGKLRDSFPVTSPERRMAGAALGAVGRLRQTLVVLREETATLETAAE